MLPPPSYRWSHMGLVPTSVTWADTPQAGIATTLVAEPHYLACVLPTGP
jgi:hypothetical protein